MLFRLLLHNALIWRELIQEFGSVDYHVVLHDLNIVFFCYVACLSMRVIFVLEAANGTPLPLDYAQA